MYLMTATKDKPSGNCGFESPKHSAIAFKAENPGTDTAHIWQSRGLDKSRLGVRWYYVGQVWRSASGKGWFHNNQTRSK